MCIARRQNVTGKNSAYMFAVEAMCALLPMIVMIYANVRMFLVVVRVTRQVSAAGVSAVGNHVVAGSNAIGPFQQSPASAMTRSVRSSRNIIIICFAYVSMVMSILVVLSTHSITQKMKTSDVEFAIVWVFFANTFINSFLYIVLHRSLRKAVKNLFRQCHS